MRAQSSSLIVFHISIAPGESGSTAGAGAGCVAAGDHSGDPHSWHSLHIRCQAQLRPLYARSRNERHGVPLPCHLPAQAALTHGKLKKSAAAIPPNGSPCQSLGQGTESAADDALAGAGDAPAALLGLANLFFTHPITVDISAAQRCSGSRTEGASVQI